MDDLDANAMRAALLALDSFWNALAADDDTAAANLLTPFTIEHLGSGPGLAGRVREFLKIAAADCLRVGYLDRVDVLTGGDLRWRYLIAEKRTYLPPGTSHWVWRIETTRIDGRWRVDPIRAATLDVIGDVTISVDDWAEPRSN